MFTENRELSFYEKSLEKTESLSKGRRAKTYFYHQAFPNLRFYPLAKGALALQGIQAIINLATTDMPKNPLANSIEEALRLHGKLNVELVEDSTFKACWVADKKNLADSPYTHQELFESLLKQQRETLQQLEQLEQLQKDTKLKQRKELEQREQHVQRQQETLQQPQH